MSPRLHHRESRRVTPYRLCAIPCTQNPFTTVADSEPSVCKSCPYRLCPIWSPNCKSLRKLLWENSKKVELNVCTMKCPCCGQIASKARPQDQFKCDSCGWRLPQPLANPKNR